jgi:hypothetical protein
MRGESVGVTERKEQDMAKDQDKKGIPKVQIDMFNWGPCVVRMRINEDFQNKLLEEAKKNEEDYVGKLAGQIKKETGYSDEARQRLLPYVSSALGLYNQAYEAYTKKKFEKAPEYILSALWINYQKMNEFNPPHDHDGKLSFVIYLKIPDELKKENKEYKGRSCGPGGIQFIYGEGPRDAVTYMSYFPVERDMFIFPAWLKHWVSPFHSDCTRISVSGNIHDSAPLNNITKFGPEYVKDKKDDSKT